MIGGVWRQTLRVLAGSLVLVATASLWQAATPPRAAAAQTDLSYISSSTWTADPAAARVHVLAAVTVTSHTAGSSDRQYFYDRIQMTLPPSAIAVGARSDEGRQLGVTVEPATGSSVVVFVDLAKRLYSGQSGTLYVYFDLVDAGGSTDRDLRIGNNLMSFPVSAFGTPGTPGSSVTVVFPSGFTVQEEFGGLTRAVFGSGEVVFASGILDDSTGLNAWFTAVQPVPASDFRVRTISIGPLRVDLRYWLDDPGWAAQVERVMRAGYPLLRDMIGLGDPIVTTFTVEEASTQETVGFSGAYDQTSGGIQVSYFADPFVILHEMAHMWFNSDLVTDRWIQEGFASYYADQAVDTLGYTNHAPVLTDRLLGAAIPLNNWISSGEPSSATDAYLYGATLEVTRDIALAAGQDGLRRVWLAVRAGQAAYQPQYGAPNEILTVRTTDWRRLLDLLEQTTGKSYSAIWREWVMDPSQDQMLSQRATALTAYAQLEGVARPWNLPPEIRRSLDTWQFDQALSLIAQARGILTQRDQIAGEAATQTTTPPRTLQQAFESSSIAAASTEAGHELSALNELATAGQARINSGGAVRDFGLLGADPQADLTAARRAFANGDLSGATQLAARARTAWESADTAGQIRILGIISLLLGGLLLLGLLIWTRGTRALAGAGVGAGGTIAASAAADLAPEGAVMKMAKRRRKPPPVVAEASSTASGEEAAEVAGAVATNSAALPEAGVAASATASQPVADHAGSNGLNGSKGSSESKESAYELLQRGHELLKDHHNAQAAVVLERAARLEESKGSILEALGRAYFNSGQHARAAETFQALLEIDPSAHYGHFALGLSFARLGRVQEARTHLRLAVALDPASDTYRRALDRMDAAAR